ncbi:hypothetical protein C8R44DRAFT_727298 [Mycena epipterygia]|nr:hypothetical protein C8R44DRAFT_727298 [Mycena epipterygia]
MRDEREVGARQLQTTSGVHRHGEKAAASGDTSSLHGGSWRTRSSDFRSLWSGNVGRHLGRRRARERSTEAGREGSAERVLPEKGGPRGGLHCDATRVRGASRWLKQDLRSGCSHRRRTPPRKESHKDEAAVSGLASTCNPCAKGTVDPGSGSCDLGGTGSSYTHALASVASWGCPYALGAIIRSPRA